MTRRPSSSALFALVTALALGMPVIARAGGSGDVPTGMTGMTGMTAGPDGWVTMPAEHLHVMIDAAPAGSTLEVPKAV